MADPRKLLLIDDDPGFRRVYRKLLSAAGYEVVEAADAPAAARAFEAGAFDLAIVDLMLPPSGSPEEGARLARQFTLSRPACKVVVVSGSGETRLALSTIEAGAYDFITKPVDPDVLMSVLSRASARLRLEERVDELERSLATDTPGAVGMLGSSTAFEEARMLCERAAPTEVPLLLTGDTGTGKEVFARYAHRLGRRAAAPFLAVNCGALPETLLESTLFGHRKGAFSGAVKDAPGLFVEADGGTLFLDELGDMPSPLQVKLLRALESGEVLPVGATHAVTVDVRLISATHRPLLELVAQGRFREDLYYRICGIEVHLPRLHDRAGDLPALAAHFLNQARTLVPNSGAARLSLEALRALEAYAWPGNLRELRHEMQRALVMAGGRDEILLADLSARLRGACPDVGEHASEDGELTVSGSLETKIEALERREIASALVHTDGNKSRAAQLLGLSRQGLLNKMARYGMT